MFAKAVFQSLVTGECVKNGGDGFIEIPALFYPLLTDTSKGDLQSHNPIYKLNLYGIMKNTHKSYQIAVKRDELLQTIAPEYIDKEGYLKISGAKLHDSLITSAQEATTKIPVGLLVKNFYIGNSDGLSLLYFRKQ
jgi:hypothetical protein